MKLATIQTPQGNRAVLFHDGAHIDINATDSTLPSSVKAILEAGTEAFDKAVDYIAGGGDIALIEKKYTLTEELKNKLLNK